MIHHNTVPQLGVVTVEAGVSGDFYPIIFHHILQCFVAGEWGQSSLHRKILYIVYFEVIHAVSFEGEVLLLDLHEFFIYLT